jgi:hypothetical protein
VAGGGIVDGAVDVEGVGGEEKEEVRSCRGLLRGGKGVAGVRAGVGGPEDDAGEEGCTTHILFSR